ncbi:MAG: 5'/3'-nucleotidase SurE [Bacteroidales bacterium]|nr:5'/3'-nucleotidase SurE [Bacteroidales bacterium]
METTGEKLNILITNDDGVKSKGISALIDMMRPYGDITVVAPFEAMSGMSAALTIGKPLRLTELKSEEGLKIFACSGTPADCVKMAMNQLFSTNPPHLLVSGINHGSNASVASLYSGTLGAAAEGTVYGIPSVGFSLSSHHRDADFSASIHYGKIIIDQYLKNPPKPEIFLNVNFPDKPLNSIKGIKFCHQGKGQWIKEFEERTDPYGFHYYWMTGEFFNLEPDNRESDHNLVEDGYISIVPHKIDTTDYSEVERLSGLWEL